MLVYQAINKVQSALCKRGIGKDSTNTFDNYKFRGIDAVYNALSPLLAEHGLCILPRMISRTCEERVSQKGGALFYVTVEAEFDFVCAEDGTSHVVKTYGEAMDRGDKATNKAMSAAYKYAAFQAFGIPTEGDNDADSSSHEVKPKPESFKSITKSVQDKMPPETMAKLKSRADGVMDAFAVSIDDAFIQYDAAKVGLDADEQTAMWGLLPSNVRTAIKKFGQQKNEVS